MKLRPDICLAGAALLAVAACNDADEPAVEPLEAGPEEVAVVTDFDPLTRDYSLDQQAQTRRDSFDEEAFRTEYSGYREQDAGAGASGGADASGSSSPDTQATGSDSASGAEADGATQAGGNASAMRARENMTFEYLDRNDDNRLSVAEYAIWAIPVSPQHQAMNDQGQPELKAETINKAADSFFYYDRDGDSYLDSEELAAARRGQTFTI